MQKRPSDDPPPGNAELLMRCRRGDAAAWRLLVDRHEGLVLGIARAHGLQFADADDVFQVVFAELFRSLDRIRDPGRIDRWIGTAARRSSVRLLRRERRRADTHARASYEERGEATVEPPETELVALEERLRIRRAIEELGEPCRSLLVGLFSSPRRSYRQLSKQLGLAIGSLGSTRSRCLHRLRQMLARHSLLESLALPRQAGSEEVGR